MQNQLNELKRKMLEFFQRVKSKINHRKSEKVSEEKKSDVTGGRILSILGSIFGYYQGSFEYSLYSRLYRWAFWCWCSAWLWSCLVR